MRNFLKKKSKDSNRGGQNPEVQTEVKKKKPSHFLVFLTFAQTGQTEEHLEQFISREDGLC
jgi:hypothetical protein